MSESTPQRITLVIDSLQQGKPRASEELLPLVYDHLRRLAQARMAKLPPGNTLQPTALVHEAYMKLVSGGRPGWDGRGHFFAAAAEAMRQILVDQARRKAARKHGGGQRRVDVDDVQLPIAAPADNLLDLDRALRELEAHDRTKAEVVLLRYFAGLTREEIADTLEISPRTVDRNWTYARAWLHRSMNPEKRGDDR